MTERPRFSLAERLRHGETVFTGWCGLNVPLVAELVAREGFPAVTLDQQHGLFDTASTANGIAAVRLGGAAPVVRVPVADNAVVSRVLDFGAEGVIAPMINTVGDARAFAAAAKYPPIGERSWGPARALQFTGLGGKEYLREANAGTVTLAMIETRTALTNLDAILAVDGIDAVFVGPSDLSITLSNGKDLEPQSDTVEAAIRGIIAAANAAGKIAGAYAANGARAAELARMGFRFIAVGSDTAFLLRGAAAELSAANGAQ